MKYYEKFIEKIIDNTEKNKIITDLIIPAGYNCTAATSLRDDGFYLRRFSSPWDFVFLNGGLDTLINIFESKNFTWFKDRKILKTKSARSDKIVDVMDNVFGIVDPHNFIANFDDHYFEEFYLKMSRRYERIIKFINNSETIAFISFFRNDSNEKIFNFLDRFYRLFNKNYIYISIIHSKEHNYREKTFINGNFRIIKVECKFFDDKYGPWYSNMNSTVRRMVLKNLYKRIELSGKNYIVKNNEIS